nr:hypothetical protein 1634Bnrm1_p047 [Cryptomonas sp.]
MEKFTTIKFIYAFNCFKKNIFYSLVNYISFLDLFSRKNEIIFYANNHKQILNLFFALIKNKKKMELIMSICNLDPIYNISQFLFYKDIVKLDKIKHEIFKGLTFSKKCQIIGKYVKTFRSYTFVNMVIKFNSVVFFSLKMEKISLKFKKNKDSIMPQLIEDILVKRYLFGSNKDSRIDSFVNLKNVKKNSIYRNINLFFFLTRLYNVFQTLIYKRKENVRESIENCSSIQNLFLFSVKNRYFIFKLSFLKKKLYRENLLSTKDSKIYLIALLFSSKSFKKMFNNFLFVLITELISCKKGSCQQRWHLKILLIFFPNYQNLNFFNLAQIFMYMRYTVLTIYVLFQSVDKSFQLYLIFLFFLRLSQKMLYPIINQVKTCIKMYWFLHLSKNIQNETYIKTNILKKKRKFILLKCEKCLLLILEFYLNFILLQIGLKKNFFYIFKSNIFQNLIKYDYNFKIRCCIFSLNKVIKIKIKKLKGIKKKNFKFYIIFLKNFFICSQLQYKKCLHLVKKTLKGPVCLLYLLFLLDSNLFYKLGYKKNHPMKFIYFKKIISHHIHYKTFFIFMDKLNIFVRKQKGLFLSNFKHIDTISRTQSSKYTTIGPNRSHILRNICIELLEKENRAISLLRITSDSLKILLTGIVSRFIHIQIIKIFCNKRRFGKNEYFQIKEINTKLNDCSISLNSFFTKYLFLLYKRLIKKEIFSIQEMCEKFLFLSIFLFSNFANIKFIDFIDHFLLKKINKITYLSIQRGICMLFQHNLERENRISVKEKNMKKKTFQPNNKNILKVCKFFIFENGKKSYDYILFKFLFKLSLTSSLTKLETDKKLRIIFFLKDIIRFSKKNVFSIKLQSLLIFVKGYIKYFLQLSIKNISINKKLRSKSKNWNITLIIIILKRYLRFFWTKKKKPNIEKQQIFYKRILDSSEISLVDIKNWKKHIYKFINTNTGIWY